MLPDFLCIGAQKSGTTWLCRNIEKHPEIWIPPFKEIHYFDNLRSKIELNIFVKTQIERRVRRLIKMPFFILHSLRKGDYQRMKWFLRWYFLMMNDSRYTSLFNPDKGQISGELTPGYSIIKSEEIAKVKGILPNVKIIYLLRNPVERVWSQIAMIYHTRKHRINRLMKNQSFEIRKISNDFIERILRRPSTYLHSDYISNINRWEDYFNKEQIFYGFFEEIIECPELLLKRLYNFLKVQDFDHSSCSLREKKNFRIYPKIPETLSSFLYDKMYCQIVELHNRFDNQYTLKWLEKANLILKK